MVVQIFGLIDILTGACFLFDGLLSYVYFNFLEIFVKIFAGLLLVKGGVFAIGFDFLSILDVLCAIIIFISIWAVVPIQLVLIISFYLILKGVMSLAVLRE